MKKCKWCDTEKKLEDFHKHKRMKDGRLNKCKTCVKEAVDAWRKKNPECRKKEHARNRERKGFKTREEYLTDKKSNAIGRKAVVLKYTTKRRTQMKNTDELTDFVLAEMCELRDMRKEATGFDWHVDHTVPLNHQEACGLHTACNLQLVPASWNVRKGNRNMERWEY